MLCAATGITSTPATAAPAEDVSAMALVRMTFTSLKDNRLLDVPGASTADNTAIVVNPAPGSAQTWRINTGTAPDAGFTIVNDKTGKCLDAPRILYQLRQQPCDGRATEKWYFQPVEGRQGAAYMIRHHGDDACMTPQTPGQPDNGAYTNTCDGSRLQQWAIPENVRETVWHAAVDYAAMRCNKDTSTCSWGTTTQSPPFAMPEVCVSPVWFNDTPTTILWTFTLNTSTGWTNTIGAKLSGTLSIGGQMSPLQLQVTAEVHGETSLNLKEDLGNSLQVNVAPRNYGWVALSELATKVTGTWTFDAQGFAWDATDTITVPLKHDETGGASIYSARTRTVFTNCAGV
nr:RICIN domain-containing protein [Kibdelosporangium sp. MJ126-NF4]